jgi:hypothetical protein
LRDFSPILTAEEGRERLLFLGRFLFTCGILLRAQSCGPHGFICSGHYLCTEHQLMPKLLNRSNRVRYRTEKSLFFSDFAAKFLMGSAANRTLSAVNKKGVFGLVR